MTAQEIIAHHFAINVRQPVDSADGYHVFYAPRLSRLLRSNGDVPRPVPTPFEAVVRVLGETTSVHWVSVPRNPEVSEEEFGQDASSRVAILHGWLERLSSLISSVETWVKELDWATRRIDIPLKDSHSGKYKVSGLLMQEGKDRILLEPRGRSSSGTEGVVDLYLMPAYDDIASLCYYDGRWNLHYLMYGTVGVPMSEAPAKPLSKETLQEVLQEMKQNAASF